MLHLRVAGTAQYATAAWHWLLVVTLADTADKWKLSFVRLHGTASVRPE
jgi:hypothetical protein